MWEKQLALHRDCESRKCKTQTMKTNPKSYRGFGQYPDRALAEKAATIYHGMTNSSPFPDPAPDMETFNAARLAFIAALEKASSRTNDDIAAKNAARRLLTTLMAAQGNHVTLLANGDAATLKEAGFDSHRQSKPRPICRETKKTALERWHQFLVVIMLMKAVKGVARIKH